MEDYEIRDTSNRRSIVLPLINIDIEINQGVITYLNIENVGGFPAYDVQFIFPKGIIWPRNKELPPLLKNGTKVFPVGRKYSFFYHTYVEIINDDSVPTVLEIEVSYINPSINKRINDTFHVNFLDFFDSSVRMSELEEVKHVFESQMTNLIREMKSINNSIEEIGNISAPTGLDLSYSTLINLKSLVSGDYKIRKYNPNSMSRRGFQEILGIDFFLASKINQYFSYDHTDKKLMDIEGMSEEVKKAFLENFEYKEGSTKNNS